MRGNINYEKYRTKNIDYRFKIFTPKSPKGDFKPSFRRVWEVENNENYEKYGNNENNENNGTKHKNTKKLTI